MLPNRLTMSAFGPYHQVVTIDFEPFIQDGLFLITGPTGAGKTMIAKRIPTILPPLTKEESMELTKLYSIVGGLNANQPLILERPFREVHHTTTTSALIGGGLIPRPG